MHDTEGLKALDGATGIGIDGGGGTMRVAVYRGSTLLREEQLAGAQMQLIGPDAFKLRLRAAIDNALSAAQAELPLRALGMGLSGVDRPQEVTDLYEWIRHEYPEVTHGWVGNDAYAPLRGGAGALNGVLLVAGTGSIAVGCAPDADGQLLRMRVGGWGGLMDDAGSAFWFGRHLLQFACRAADGRAAHGSVVERVTRKLDIPRALDLIPRVCQLTPAIQRAEVAGLAVLVSELAAEGDAYGQQLEQRGAHELALLVLTCARQLRALPGARPASPLPVILHGGIVQRWHGLQQRLIRELASSDPDLRPIIEPADPLAGALALAREHPWTNL